MISKKKSIFHIAEDADEAGKKVVLSIRGRSIEGEEGLRILIHPEGQGGSSAGIKSRATAACITSPTSKGLPELGFLKSCFLCRKELSQSKDVYMYRGDMGFCSEECRSHQIMPDERREFELATRDRWRAPPPPTNRHRPGNKFQESDRDQQIPATV